MRTIANPALVDTLFLTCGERGRNGCGRCPTPPPVVIRSAWSTYEKQGRTSDGYRQKIGVTAMEGLKKIRCANCGASGTGHFCGECGAPQTVSSNTYLLFAESFFKFSEIKRYIIQVLQDSRISHSGHAPNV